MWTAKERLWFKYTSGNFVEVVWFISVLNSYFEMTRWA